MGNCISRPCCRSTSYYPSQVRSSRKATTGTHKKNRSTYASHSAKMEDGFIHSYSSSNPEKEKCDSESSHTSTLAQQGTSIQASFQTKFNTEGDSAYPPSHTSSAHHDHEDDSTHISTSVQQGALTHTFFTARIEGDSTHLPPSITPHPITVNEGTDSNHLPPPNSIHEDDCNIHQESGSTHPSLSIKSEMGSTQPSVPMCASSEGHSSTEKKKDNFMNISSSQTGNSESSSHPHFMTSAKLVSCKPGKPVATDITGTSVDLKWTKPEQSAKNIICYTIFYHCASDPDDQWREQKVGSAEERATVSGLTGKNVYYFKVQSEFEDGVQSESDVSEPITSLESITLKNMIERAWKARIKWYWIGLQLEVEATDLDVIRITNNDRPDTCFREMIKKWLNLTGGSWRKLIDALNHKSVDHHELAQSLATEIGLTVAYKNADVMPDAPGKYSAIIYGS